MVFYPGSRALPFHSIPSVYNPQSLMLTHYRPPDNEKRATRLQQLVDSMANMQTDVKNIGDNMDEKNEQYRPAIDALLKANGMDSVDDVINKAAAEMTDEERRGFEAVRYRCRLRSALRSDWYNELTHRGLVAYQGRQGEQGGEPGPPMSLGTVSDS